MKSAMQDIQVRGHVLILPFTDSRLWKRYLEIRKGFEQLDANDTPNLEERRRLRRRLNALRRDLH